METLQWSFDSQIGRIYLVASESGLKSLLFHKQKVPMATSLKVKSPAVAFLSQAVRELEEYFAGKRTSFDVKLDVEGTEFQKKVWKQLQKIPYGATCAYQDVARKIHNAKAVRAVGTANGRNPVCIIVPCHRVIAANGSLGGYTAGLQIKTQLLRLEQGA
jgi:methylated-DNA-[protein]-cysteine S-methyltransferase